MDDFSVNKNNRLSLYLQLMDLLIKEIHEGKYREHEKIPSERELCDIYQLSRITVRQALQELEREGFIYKLQGKGTFVAPISYNQNLVKLYSFSEEMRKMGKEPATKVESFQKMAIDERLALRMNLSPSEEVFQVVRLRSADDEPLMYETSYLPAKFFPALSEKDLAERSMYDIFYQDYKIIVEKAIERFSAVVVRPEEAIQLKMEPNQPAMLIKRFSYFQESLIEYTISVARGDKFDYSVELT